MSDISENSDVNPSEMARMVEELDDLDDSLFGVKSKKDTFPVAKGDMDVKKKISFKDTIVGDPLADISSDSDNSYSAKKPSKTNPKSNRMADLFGIKNSEPSEKGFDMAKIQNASLTQKIDTHKDKPDIKDNNLSMPITNQSLNRTQTTLPPTHPPVQSIREQPKAVEEIVPKMEDALKLSTTRDRKSTLMEDMFGVKGRPALIKHSDTRPISSKLGSENPPSLLLAEASKTEKVIKTSTAYAPPEHSTVRESRRGRRNSPIISDPLGLFTAPPTQQEPVIDAGPKIETAPAEKSLSQNELPEWLGGSSKSESKQKSEKQTRSTIDGRANEASLKAIGSKISDLDSREAQSGQEPTLLLQPKKEYFSPDVSMLISSQFDQQAAIISMQQQEHELRTATTLSHQNEQLSQIVDSQRSKLDEQERMFNALIKRQIDRQSMLETQMRIQQARIDHYIQTLMAQPTSLPSAVTVESKTEEDNRDVERVESSESLVRKLQMETDYLESTLERMRQKHEKEIEILEESYEKQILFLRQSMEKTEKKMQQENEFLEQESERKLEKLKSEKEKMEQCYQEEIERLKKNEKLLVEEHHNRHSHNMELLEKEHAETIDGITRAKEVERSAIDSIATHKTDLGELLQQSNLIIDGFRNFQETLEEKDQQLGQNRENFLKKQEANLQILRDQLNSQLEAVTEERKCLAMTCQKLDTATASLNSDLAKRSKVIQETEERLAIRERGLIRDKELFDEQVKWERQHLQAMKETWIKEQERQIKSLSEEREAVATEKTKLQVMNKLQNGSDEMAKVELEAALKTAHEVANEVNIEKRRWRERVNALEEQKKELRAKEKYLVERAKELEHLTQSALAKRDEGLRALKQAQLIEQQHKERLGQLQTQLESLAERENKVATEKLALARERLATRFALAEKPEKDVERVVEPMEYLNDRFSISNSIGSTHFKDVVDPHLLLLKLNLDNKLEITNEIVPNVN